MIRLDCVGGGWLSGVEILHCLTANNRIYVIPAVSRPTRMRRSGMAGHQPVTVHTGTAAAAVNM